MPGNVENVHSTGYKGDAEPMPGNIENDHQRDTKEMQNAEPLPGNVGMIINGIQRKCKETVARCRWKFINGTAIWQRQHTVNGISAVGWGWKPNPPRKLLNPIGKRPPYLYLHRPRLICSKFAT
ncbi:hypothetical protein CABS02_15303 [Colletotrichum abscissum]|uniref:Uncharacterized protein n=1 Tax=Colletotrichum abscissum TaxID=1671311 RepID=A0A9Q0AVC8_9PEZI|nr:hypothetical protein CABS02_15303 [Colletotrichum abscissum]